jgi:hypothetical protein
MADLLEYLVEARLAGDVATTRESNYEHARALAAGVEPFQFGLPPLEDWPFPRVLALMAERVGIDPDVNRSTGTDVIDPHLTIGALERMRDRIRLAMEQRERIILGSGHPAGIVDIHLALAAALRGAGCELLTAAVGQRFTVEWATLGKGDRLQVRFVGGVGMCSERGAALWHSHSPRAMELMLADLTERGEPWPSLVIGDHGFAGAAAAAGIDVVCFADCNDPALFVGEAEGRVRVTVPIDDNVQPHLYGPVSAFLLS